MDGLHASDSVTREQIRMNQTIDHSNSSPKRSSTHKRSKKSLASKQNSLEQLNAQAAHTIDHIQQDVFQDTSSQFFK